MGLRVGIVSQPRWDTPEDFVRMGRPRLFVGVSSGTVDSMINNYTANKKDPLATTCTPKAASGGKPARLRERCLLQARAPGFPGHARDRRRRRGVLRRLAHYDYWQNKIRPSILTELAGRFSRLRHGRAHDHGDPGRGISKRRSQTSEARSISRTRPPNGRSTR